MKISEESKIAVLDLFYNTIDNQITTISEQTGLTLAEVNRIIDLDLKTKKNAPRTYRDDKRN